MLLPLFRSFVPYDDMYNLISVLIRKLFRSIKFHIPFFIFKDYICMYKKPNIYVETLNEQCKISNKKERGDLDLIKDSVS